MRNLIRGLTVGGIRARGVDLQEEVITLKAPASKLWALDNTTGVTIADTTENNQPQGVIQYDFAQRGGKDIVLDSTFDLPSRPTASAASNSLSARLLARPPLPPRIRRQGLRDRPPPVTGEREWTVVTLQPERAPTTPTTPPRSVSGFPGAKSPGPHSDVTAPNQMHSALTVAESNRADAWRAKITRNYTGAMTNMPFWRYTLTSVMLVILNIIGSILSCSLAAFTYARMQWPGRNFSFMLLLATMMIPPQVTMIPFFLIIRYLGWYNTLTPLWAMSFFGNAFNIFLLVQFMKGIPRDLKDAARIDGCNSLQTWWHVFIPLVKPALACIAIFTFMGVWNDFMGPLIYLGDQRLYPALPRTLRLQRPGGRQRRHDDGRLTPHDHPRHRHLLHGPALLHPGDHADRDQVVRRCHVSGDWPAGMIHNMQYAPVLGSGGLRGGVQQKRTHRARPRPPRPGRCVHHGRRDGRPPPCP